MQDKITIETLKKLPDSFNIGTL